MSRVLHARSLTPGKRRLHQRRSVRYNNDTDNWLCVPRCGGVDPNTGLYWVDTTSEHKDVQCQGCKNAIADHYPGPATDEEDDDE